MKKTKKDHQVHDTPAYVLETGPGLFMVKLKPAFKKQAKRVETEIITAYRKFAYQERMKG
ncbi:hypothetical protein LCGC14_0355360 [marine sediment metagenome]|uniref:Uncharacterized protein n=1 Tax=marine sediment metagenome TaxID=412755 RepID=A0A0F9VWY5_9ZZZZ